MKYVVKINDQEHYNKVMDFVESKGYKFAAHRLGYFNNLRYIYLNEDDFHKYVTWASTHDMKYKLIDPFEFFDPPYTFNHFITSKLGTIWECRKTDWVDLNIYQFDHLTDQKYLIDDLPSHYNKDCSNFLSFDGSLMLVTSNRIAKLISDKEYQQKIIELAEAACK